MLPAFFLSYFLYYRKKGDNCMGKGIKPVECINSREIYFTHKEISQVCSAILDSPVDIPRELEDRVANVLHNHLQK